jgi:hypothetical protein
VLQALILHFNAIIYFIVLGNNKRGDVLFLDNGTRKCTHVARGLRGTWPSCLHRGLLSVVHGDAGLNHLCKFAGDTPYRLHAFLRTTQD